MQADRKLACWTVHVPKLQHVHTGQNQHVKVTQLHFSSAVKTLAIDTFNNHSKLLYHTITTEIRLSDSEGVLHPCNKTNCVSLESTQTETMQQPMLTVSYKLNMSGCFLMSPKGQILLVVACKL